jgi:hypothetical protein
MDISWFMRFANELIPCRTNQEDMAKEQMPQNMPNMPTRLNKHWVLLAKDFKALLNDR